MKWVAWAFGRKRALTLNVALCLAVCLSSPAWAGPTGGTVVGGQATISTAGQNTLIQQNSTKAIINWRSYSVGAGQSVIYQQPGAGSIALNRVLGGQASKIMGSIKANGQVWLVNPNGVIFGNDATVNVAGFLATTADINNSDFLAGNYNFGTPSSNPNASITNFGTIKTGEGGSAILAAPAVDNEGVIEAKLGSVAVGAGKTFAVDFDGDNLLRFQITSADDKVPLGPDGKPVSALVKNAGKISADGGTVRVTARAAGQIVDNVINTTGIVEANSVKIKNGTVILDAGNGGLNVAGTVSAAGQTAGTTGGTVEALGGKITVTPLARIDASGPAGGGTVLVGGNFHGAGPQPNAHSTTIDKGATITADAIDKGNGGRVAVWSDDKTIFNGTISAKGGPNGGNGGQVETSSAGTLAVGGFVEAGAALGAPGNWLLDPDDLTIDSAAANSIDTALNANTDVTLATSKTASPTGGYGMVTTGAAGDITVAAPLSFSPTTGATLTLSAYNSININAPITIGGTNGGLALMTNNQQGGSNTGGSLTFLMGEGSVTYTGTGGALSIGDQGTSQAYTLLYSMNDLQNINNNLSGYYALAKPLDAATDPTTPANWVPLGTDGAGKVWDGEGFSSSGSEGFGGRFNGLGNSIANLTINSSAPDLGLFGVNSGSISNLALIQASVTSTGEGAWAGTLVGRNMYGAMITNALATGSVMGAATENGGGAVFGGLVGGNDGIINGGSFANVEVRDNANYASDSLGGLAGENSGIIADSYAAGPVTANAQSPAGGDVNAGGLVGHQYNYNDAEPMIERSFATGAVTSNVPVDAPNIGGLVGWLESGAITDSYAAGSVIATIGAPDAGDVYVGGLAGWQTGGMVTRSYSVGQVRCVVADGCVPGGLIGVQDYGTVDALSFWDTQTSGQSASGSCNGECNAGVPLTTTQAQSKSYLEGLGWNFADASPPTWAIEDGKSFPYLTWRYPNGLADGTVATAITPVQIVQPQNTALANLNLINFNPTTTTTNAYAQTVNPTVGEEGATNTVAGIDPGLALFQDISPTTSADLTATSGSSNSSDETLLAFANPAPVKPAEHATAPPPRVTAAVGPYLDQMVVPSIPRPGVPGISFGYSLSGNNALW